MENFLTNKNPLFCDDIETRGYVESFAEIVNLSYKETIDHLSREYGNKLADWKWGQSHQLLLEHPMGKVSILNKIFKLNRGPYPVGGSFHTVNPFAYSFSDRYSSNFGASHRHIYSIADWNESLTVIPTGESGIPASKHYCDQTSLFLENNYHSDPFNINEVEAKAKYYAIFRGVRK